MIKYIVFCPVIAEFSVELDSAVNIWSYRKVAKE
jgi:hypothetical protein